MVDTRRGLLDDTILEASGQITATTGQVIENKVFTDLKGDSATVGYHILIPSNTHTVTIRNCRFIGGGVDSASYFYLGSAIRIRDGCHHILIENCDFVDVPRMVHAIQCTGDIVVQCNTLDTNYGSQSVQFASGTGTGYKIAYNDIISGMQRWSADSNFQATQNDFVNCFAQDGVDIVGNRIEGRDNLDPSPVASNASGVGGDYSIVGAAIIVGDSEGDDNTIRHNWTINAGTTAVMVSGGDGNTVQNNTVFSYGPDNPWVFVGVAYGWQSWGGSNCPTNGTADSSNVANFTNSFGQNAEPAQYFGIYGGCTETGIFGGTATRYTKNGSLTESGARDGWASAVDGLMETYGRFYPAGTSPAPLPDSDPVGAWLRLPATGRMFRSATAGELAVNDAGAKKITITALINVSDRTEEGNARSLAQLNGDAGQVEWLLWLTTTGRVALTGWDTGDVARTVAGDTGTGALNAWVRVENDPDGSARTWVRPVSVHGLNPDSVTWGTADTSTSGLSFTFRDPGATGMMLIGSVVSTLDGCIGYLSVDLDGVPVTAWRADVDGMTGWSVQGAPSVGAACEFVTGGGEYVPGEDVIVRRVVRARGGVRLRPWSQSWQV